MIYTDGGARGNPGPAAAGIVILKGSEVVLEVSQYLGDRQTNNWAEYEAVVIALLKMVELQTGPVSVEFRLDSKLVVEQLMGNWKIKEPTLKPQAQKVLDLLHDFKSVHFTYVPREQNKHADKLVNAALDAAGK